nr:MAG TPA: hypothetical protein [Caudoviricetes sp.]
MKNKTNENEETKIAALARQEIWAAAQQRRTEQEPSARKGRRLVRRRTGRARTAAPSYWRKSLRRCVGRSDNNADANGGLVYANTNNGSANSNTNNGVRLAIRPKESDRSYSGYRDYRNDRCHIGNRDYRRYSDCG